MDRKIAATNVFTTDVDKIAESGFLIETHSQHGVFVVSLPQFGVPMSSHSSDDLNANLSEIAGMNLDNSLRKIVRFSDLARCGDEVWIEYEGKLYRLQSTRQGKLVLTK
ncbi:hemin uptake protein HemP [Stieleria sp. ICT_E10.1]|uniref:hemin uptake protein HemP n=1 Tax=Stieleria sedimenti TaxID=2976331 RepID=UPI00217FE8AB|nr:hemin uptake protein HemP [Stieleria sedimenti]MCS7470860.1 hemin uptake protein HemP [Stieleria sedimenti]